MPKALYLCYFGLLEPLVQTQVVPYLEEIAKSGVEIELLTFEPKLRKRWPKDKIDQHRSILESKGIRWRRLGYHSRPSIPATMFDLANALVHIIYWHKKARYDLLHARGHIPAPLAAICKTLLGTKFLFDIRGFMPEEYADAGIWANGGPLFRMVKRVEKWLMSRSDGFVVLTDKARDILFPQLDESSRDILGRPVEVIPCCVDAAKFEESSMVQPDGLPELSGRKVYIYVGSFGGWYMTNEMLDLFAFVRRRDPTAFVIVLTQRESEKVYNELISRGFDDSDILVKSVSPENVGGYLGRADVAISFIRPCYSKLSSSPTKIAEYLIAGLPLIINPGVGDLDALIMNEKVGVMVAEFSDKGFIEASAEMDTMLSDTGLSGRCKEAAKKHFDLHTVAGPRYVRLYEKILNE